MHTGTAVDPGDTHALQELDLRYLQAAGEADGHWYEANLGADFLASHPGGTLGDRAAFLAHMAWPPAATRWDAFDVRVRPLGDLALIHAGIRCQQPDGSVQGGRYTHVYVRHQGRWLCVAEHLNGVRWRTEAMQATTSRPPAADTMDHQRLHELNAGFIRSVRTSDVAWFDHHLSPDFLNGNPDATLVDRAAFLRQIAPPCPVPDLDVEDVLIRIYGEAAIVHGRTTYTKPDGQAGAGRYTDVWVRQAGSWLCVSADVTRG